MKDLLVCLVSICLFGGVAAGQSVVSVCDGGTCVSVDSGDAMGTKEFAIRLNQRGGLFHDRSFSGAEVIYRSSGTATEAEARRWWMNSPPHRRLLVSGAIQQVVCVGSVCVGRGISAGVNSGVSTVQAGRCGVKKIAEGPIKMVRRFRGCR